MPGPVNMIDPQGRVVAVPEEGIADAAAAGYRIETAEGGASRLAEEQRQETYGGVGGKLAAASSGVLSGLSLGASDAALAGLGGAEELRTLKEINPISRTIGEVGGGIAASLAAPGSALARSPAGVLSRLATEGTEAARALGGVSGFVGQSLVTGAEAAAQNVGSYLGSVALGDRDLTAEGLGGALGSGFALGAAGGAAVYGIERGSIAARNLFSQVMDGGEDAARSAAGQWERKSTEVFEANRATLDEAKAKLAEAQRATQEARLGQQRAGSYLADERVLAQRAAAEPVPGGLADDVVPPPAPAGSPSAPAAAARDPIAEMEARIRAGQVPGEAGPFTPDGLRAAAERELKREDARAAVGGFEFQPRTGESLREVKRGKNLAKPAPLSAADEAAGAAPVADDIVRVETSPIGKPSEGRLEVRRYRGDSPTPFETTELNTRQVYGKQLDDFMEAQVPEGFTAANIDPRRQFEVRRGLPVAPDDVHSNALYVVRPSEVTERGIMGNTLTPAKRDGVLQRWRNGERMGPVEADMTPDGRLWIDDGNHRLQAAAQTDRPVPIYIRRRGEGWKPQSNAHDVTDRIRADLPRGGAAGRVAAPELAPLAAKVAEAEDAESALMRMLQGTKAQIDEGVTLGQVGVAARAQPVSPRQLTAQYDDLVEKAAQAADVETKQALLRQASAIDDQLARAPKAAQAMSDVDSVIAAMNRYEKAMADVADDLGGAAHPVTREMADGLRKAEGDAERRMLDRATQHIDDHVDRAAPQSWREFTKGKMGEYMKSEGGHAGAMKRLSKEWEAYKSGRAGQAVEEGAKETTKQTGGSLFDSPAPTTPAETFGPAALPSKERIAYAKARKTEADAAYQRARVGETEARQGYAAAKAKAAEIEKATQTVGLPKVGAAGASAGASGAAKALDIGAALEAANTLGIPGLPKPSDIPIVGPVLGLYLKARVLKAGAERLMGRVPASGNAQVAALASQVRDKAARAVDRMFGHVERAAPQARAVVATAGPKLLEAVKDRLFDDGSKAPPPDADLRDHVAARSREIAALASNPALIAQQVRREMRDVADPDMVIAAVKFRQAQIAYLDSVAPKAPPPSPFQREPWKPDKQTATDFARRYVSAMDPQVALSQVEQRNLTPEAAEAFRAVYPRLFAQTQTRLIEQATKLQTTLPRQQVTRMSILFGVPLDDALGGAALTRTQSAFASSKAAPEPGADQGGPPAPPAPSIAGPTDLASAYETASDRRAAKR